MLPPTATEDTFGRVHLETLNASEREENTSSWLTGPGLTNKMATFLTGGVIMTLINSSCTPVELHCSVFLSTSL